MVVGQLPNTDIFLSKSGFSKGRPSSQRKRRTVVLDEGEQNRRRWRRALLKIGAPTISPTKVCDRPTDRWSRASRPHHQLGKKPISLVSRTIASGAARRNRREHLTCFTLNSAIASSLPVSSPVRTAGKKPIADGDDGEDDGLHLEKKGPSRDPPAKICKVGQHVDTKLNRGPIFFDAG